MATITSITPAVLIAAKTLENALTTQFTATVKTMIDSFIAHNYSASAATITVHLVTSGDTAGNQNEFAVKVLQPDETYGFPVEVCRQTLEVGGFISAVSSAATAISIRASGRLVS